MGLVVNGAIEQVPGLTCASWLEDKTVAKLRRLKDVRPRATRWIRGVVLHTTRGAEGLRREVRPGRGPATARELRAARAWADVPASTGAHLLVDHDGTIACAADVAFESALHAGPVNEVTVGVEIHQGDEGELYAEQLAAAVRLLDWLTLRFHIQRQTPGRYVGRPTARIAAGGRDVVGVYGHRDVSAGGGAGDPGDEIFQHLADAGYERWDFEAGEDLAVWRARQEVLVRRTGATLDVDGIPGPATSAALRAAGRPGGLWVARPGD